MSAFQVLHRRITSSTRQVHVQVGSDWPVRAGTGSKSKSCNAIFVSGYRARVLVVVSLCTCSGQAIPTGEGDGVGARDSATGDDDERIEEITLTSICKEKLSSAPSNQ